MEFSLSNESCRVCLQKSHAARQLSETFRRKEHTDTRTTTTTLLDLLHLCTGTDVEPAWLQSAEARAFFPRKICFACERLLLAAYELRKKSSKSEKVLQNILNLYDDDEEALSVLDNVKPLESDEPHDDIQKTAQEDLIGDEEVIVDQAAMTENSTLLIVEPLSTVAHIRKRSSCDSNIFPMVDSITVEEMNKEGSDIIDRHDSPVEEYIAEDMIEDFYDMESIPDDDDDEEEEYDESVLYGINASPTVSNSVQCVDCDKFVSARFLSRHRETHLDPTERSRPYGCDLCGVHFTLPENLAKHKRIHREDKRYACSICGKTFLHWSTRQYHIAKQHTDEKRFACEYCGSKFRQSSHYIIHLRRHTGIAPYVCSLCNRDFKSVTALKEHMLSHSDERQFSCNLCKKQFKSAKYLKLHQRIHNKELNYLCSACGKAFGRNSSLRLHMKRTHPEVELPTKGTIVNIKAINRLRSVESTAIDQEKEPKF